METTKETGLVLNAGQFGIESSKAKQLEAVFLPMVEKFKSLEEEYNAIMATDQSEISEEICSQARELRLTYLKIRTGTDAIHKEQKANLLIQTRAIDGLRNIVKFATNENEEELGKIEKHYENLEITKLDEREEQRKKALEEFEFDNEYVNIRDMEPDVWDNFLIGIKSAYEQKVLAEKKAEENRIRLEKIEELHDKRKEEILPVWQFIGSDVKNRNLGEIEDDEWEKIVDSLKKSMNDHEAEQKRILADKKRLEAEAKVQAAELEKERLASEKQAKEHEKTLEAERQEKKRIEAALKANQDAANKVELDRKMAEQKARLAPDKTKLITLAQKIDDMDLPVLQSTEAQAISDSIRKLLDKTTTYIREKSEEL